MTSNVKLCAITSLAHRCCPPPVWRQRRHLPPSGDVCAFGRRDGVQKSWRGRKLDVRLRSHKGCGAFSLADF